jgi:hypothetical protein
MNRSLKASLVAGVALSLVALAPDAHATVTTINSTCEIDTGLDCSGQCTTASFSCDVSAAATCGGSCTESVEVDCEPSCETSCGTECTADPGSFTCTGYCGTSCEGQCGTTCTGNSDVTTCTTQCQAACTDTCNTQCTATPPSVSCTTACQTSCQGSCTAQANLSCNVSCQAKASANCSVTPGSCTASCSGSGAVVVCNGKVVDVADSLADAEVYVVDNIEADFQVSVNAACSGNTCTASISGCSTVPGTDLGGLAFLGGALGFGLTFVSRRRRR